MWLRNCWQVIAFATRDRRRAAGAHRLRRGGRAVPHRLWPRGRARRPLPASLCAAVARPRRSASRSSAAITGCASTPTAHCVRVPGQDTVPRQARVRSYPLVERHSFAWIWLGDDARADPGQNPGRALVRSSGLGGVGRLPPFRRQLPARERQPARPLARELRARGHHRQRGGGGGAVHREPRRRQRAHASRHVRHGSAAVLQAHHRFRLAASIAGTPTHSRRPACTSSRTDRCRRDRRTRARRWSARCSTSSRRRR